MSGSTPYILTGSSLGSDAATGSFVNTQNEHILYVPSPEDSSAPEVPSLEEEADTHTPRRRWAARACGGSSLSFPGGACGSVVPSLAPRRLVVFVGEGCVLCVLLLCHRA